MTQETWKPGTIEAARREEAWAIEAISARLQRVSFALVRYDRPGGAPDLDWEDVAQEASRRFFTAGIHQFRGDAAETTYLTLIVRSSWLQLARRGTRRRRWESEFLREPQKDNVTSTALLEAESILARISEPCRELLTRVFLEGEPYVRLADDFGLAESSVRARVSRCLEQARVFSVAEGARAGVDKNSAHLKSTGQDSTGGSPASEDSSGAST